MKEFSALPKAEKEKIFSLLAKDPAKHALVLQNLRAFPENSKFFFLSEGKSYLHLSGHPAHQGPKATYVIDGDPREVEALLREVHPKPPFAVRESPASLQGALRAVFPEMKFRLEHRMDVTRQTFKPHHQGKARQLTENDLPSLCAFTGAPPKAAPRFMGWIKGAKIFYGIEESGELRAIGSTMVCLPEVYNLVSIETHTNHRGQGYGTELTSALVEKCFEFTNTVCLTVFADNPPALKLYEKLGFKVTEDRMWVDCD